MIKKVIYISHKYGGNKENKNNVERIIKELKKEYPNYLFISPIHALGFLYDDVSYEQGIQECFYLLTYCDEMWVCSEDSKGVLMEKEMCDKMGIKVRKCF